MKKKISKSRSLRKRLLIALIACLLMTMIICTSIFEIIYKQTDRNVHTHFSEFSDKTISVASDTLYQRNTANMQTGLYCFCSELGRQLQEQYLMGSTWDYSYYYRSIAMLYFRDLNFENCVFFAITDVGIRTMDIDTEKENDEKVFEAFDEMTRSGNYENSDTQSFDDYLYENYLSRNAFYTKGGEGFIIVWDSMDNYMVGERCVGLVMYDSNNWIKKANEVASNETERLTQSMDKLFGKYIYIMLTSVTGVLIVFVIISAILSKKLADPVVSEHDLLVKVNEMKTTFLSDASHELKTPLAAMSGYAQNAEIALMNGGNNTLIQEKLKRISSEANRMALMVTQILDATRIEEGRMILELAPCDLDSLVREIVETYFSVLNKNNNRLAIRIPIELPKVEADSTRLQRVFVNLISNALKHTHNGTILIKAEEDEECVKVTVKDTGSGISEDELPHIWERYYKGKHSETGTGLGLFICKFIIESHGGKIWAESEVGKGTSFTFTLPLATQP